MVKAIGSKRWLPGNGGRHSRGVTPACSVGSTQPAGLSLVFLPLSLFLELRRSLDLLLLERLLLFLLSVVVAFAAGRVGLRELLREPLHPRDDERELLRDELRPGLRPGVADRCLLP